MNLDAAGTTKSDHKQDQPRFINAATCGTRFRLGEFVGKRGSDAVARHAQRRCVEALVGVRR